MIEIKGKANIVVRVVCDSISPDRVRLTTLECEYPRIIHSEVMTHRMFSRNAASSRAIPFEKMLNQLNGIPVRFGAANKGMQDKGKDYAQSVVTGYYADCYQGGPTSDSPLKAWEVFKQQSIKAAKAFHDAGYHKQVYNRLVEPFQMIKTVISATEWNNFFHLRLDSAADPTIYELARCMKEAMDSSLPQELEPGEWHLPYVDYNDFSAEYVTWALSVSPEECYATTVAELAIKTSAARCAAVSFRNEDYPIAKCLEVYDRLVGDERVHASALEHQATPMGAMEFTYGDYAEPKGNVPSNGATWQEGVTHSNRFGDLYSGNFRGWVQHRQTVPNSTKEG